MKSVLDDLRPEPRQKMWQKFENEGIVHKEYVPPRHTVNGKFYCDVLRRMRETPGANIQTSGVTTPGLCIMTTLRLTQFWRLRIRQSSPTPLLIGPGLLWFLLFSKMKLILRGDVLTALKWSRPNRRTWRRRLREMTSRSASDHGNPAEIAV